MVRRLPEGLEVVVRRTGPVGLGLGLWSPPNPGGHGVRRYAPGRQRSAFPLRAAYCVQGEPENRDPSDRLSRSVHGAKLIEALWRFDRDGDPLWRSVAVHWFEWV